MPLPALPDGGTPANPHMNADTTTAARSPLRLDQLLAFALIVATVALTAALVVFLVSVL